MREREKEKERKREREKERKRERENERMREREKERKRERAKRKRDRWMAAGLWKVFLTVVESLESEDSMLSGSRFGNPTVL